MRNIKKKTNCKPFNNVKTLRHYILRYTVGNDITCHWMMCGLIRFVVVVFLFIVISHCGVSVIVLSFVVRYFMSILVLPPS